MTYELNNTNASHDLALPGEVHVASDADMLFDELGCWFTAIGLKAVRDRGVFHIALSGGTTPWPFYHRLLIDTRFRKVPWEHTHIWIVDERRVPFEDERSNYRSLRESLLDDIPTPQEQVHPMQVMSDDPAGEYEDQLKLAFDSPTETPRLDFVLLGMGDDCHTASLFPQSDAIHVSDRWVVVNDGPKVTPPPRVTMTYPLLNAARHLAVLCTGSKKADALRRVSEQMKNGPDPDNLPITGIQPADGELAWYLDRAAAGVG